MKKKYIYILSSTNPVGDEDTRAFSTEEKAIEAMSKEYDEVVMAEGHDPDTYESDYTWIEAHTGSACAFGWIWDIEGVVLE